MPSVILYTRIVCALSNQSFQPVSLDSPIQKPRNSRPDNGIHVTIHFFQYKVIILLNLKCFVWLDKTELDENFSKLTNLFFLCLSSIMFFNRGEKKTLFFKITKDMKSFFETIMMNLFSFVLFCVYNSIFHNELVSRLKIRCWCWCFSSFVVLVYHVPPHASIHISLCFTSL